MTSEYTYERPVRFAETDAAGIVHFSSFFLYMEECEHAFLESIGACAFQRDGWVMKGWPRVNVQCSYLEPLRYGDLCQVRLLIERIGTSSLSYAFELINKHPEGSAVAARGRMTTVWVEVDSEGLAGGSHSIPESVRVLIEEAPKECLAAWE